MPADQFELTTVADDLVVYHRGEETFAYGPDDGVSPESEFEFHGVAGRTLRRPPGELLCRFVTINDIHFGEVECGRIDDNPQGPIQSVAPGETPYPTVMNHAARPQIEALDPAAVIVKGDLTADGQPEEWDAFENCYRPSFGERLYAVRGNHDAYQGQHRYAGDQWIELPGIAVALLDTVLPTQTTGDLGHRQIYWLDEHLGGADGRRVLVLGHHQQWIHGKTDSDNRHDGYFGLHPAASDALDAVFARHPNALAYAAGHTHRHRVRTMLESGAPSIEVGCVKDFPGTFAEYRVYEGGVMQVVHRISAPDAMRWSNRCRLLYRDFGVEYEEYALGTLEQRCFVLPERT